MYSKCTLLKTHLYILAQHSKPPSVIRAHHQKHVDRARLQDSADPRRGAWGSAPRAASEGPRSARPWLASRHALALESPPHSHVYFGVSLPHADFAHLFQIQSTREGTPVVAYPAIKRLPVGAAGHRSRARHTRRKDSGLHGTDLPQADYFRWALCCPWQPCSPPRMPVRRSDVGVAAVVPVARAESDRRPGRPLAVWNDVERHVSMDTKA